MSRFEALPAHILSHIFEIVADAGSHVHDGIVHRRFAARAASSQLPTLSRRLRESAERGLYASILLRHELVWLEVARQLKVRPERARYIRHLDIQTTGCVLDAPYRAMADVITQASPGLQSLVLNIHYSDLRRFASIVSPVLADTPALRHFGLTTMPQDGLAQTALRVVAMLDAVVARVHSCDITLGCFQGEYLETQVRDVPRLSVRPRRLERLRIFGSWLQLVADLTRPPCPLRMLDLWDYRSRASAQTVLNGVHPATAARIQHMPSWNGLDASRFSALELDGRGGLRLKQVAMPAAAVVERSVTPEPLPSGPAAAVVAVAAPTTAAAPAARPRAPRRKAVAPVPTDGPASRTRSRTAAAANGTAVARASNGGRRSAHSAATDAKGRRRSAR